jgi:RNA-directed DNA polymerase
VITQRTATDRFSRAVKHIGGWCREHRHDAESSQHAALSRQLRGHDGYYGITGSSRMLGRLLSEVKRRWRYWLNRRSQRRSWTRERFGQYLAAQPLPPPIAIHSIDRLAAHP